MIWTEDAIRHDFPGYGTIESQARWMPARIRARGMADLWPNVDALSNVSETRECLERKLKRGHACPNGSCGTSLVRVHKSAFGCADERSVLSRTCSIAMR